MCNAYFIVALIWISLIINKFEHLFMCLLVLCRSSLWGVWSTLLPVCYCAACLFIELSEFWCVLKESPLSDLCTVNIFSQSMTDLFIWLIVCFKHQVFSFEHQVFNFDEVQFLHFISGCAFFFFLAPGNHCLTQSCQEFLLFSSRCFIGWLSLFCLWSAYDFGV